MTAYKSGKGYFVGIDNGASDYMFFGSTNLKIGETAIYEEGKPSRDGRPTIKTMRSDAIEAFEARDEDRAKPTQIPYRAHDAPKLDSREAYWAAKEKKDAEREPIITRLSCISSAAQVYSGAQGKSVIWAEVMELAAIMEKFAKEGI